MEENLIICVILILAFCFFAFLTVESQRQKKDRKALKHVIYVNGIRGKTSVTRMIAAGLRQGGYRVLCKTTGTLPMVQHVDGRIEEINRKAPANIREQLDILHLAAKEKADVLVVECMALLPENQYISQHRMLQADIGVLTNVRMDHMDVFGDTKEEILEALLNTMPKKGTFVTGEKELFGNIVKKGKELGTKCVLAEPTELDDGIEFPDNSAIERLVCEELGVEPLVSREGFMTYDRDPYSKEIITIGNTVFVNALSANDTESTLKILEEGTKLVPEDSKKILLINNRGDRPARALAMCEIPRQWKPDEIILIGENLLAVKRRLNHLYPGLPVYISKNIDDVPLDQKEPTIILAAGNLRGPGIELTERTRLLGKGGKNSV